MQPAAGRWNRLIGWTLLVAGFTWAAWLDPWSLAERNPALITGGARMVARHGQAVVLAMAFLQLLCAELLAAAAPRPRLLPAVLTGLGALLYAAGYVLEPWRPEAVWLVPVGAALNAGGFAVLAAELAGRRRYAWARVILPILCLGMLLDGVMGLSRVSPAVLSLAYLGPEDGVRLRMLRLARAAVTALSVTAFLYQGLVERAGPPSLPSPRGGGGWGWGVRAGQVGLWIGVMGMPSVLAAAAFLRLEIKYLLPIPALATFSGVCVGVTLAARHARPLEVWGWVLIAASMGAGLFMGLYAFDGPVPTPDFLGAYNDWPRRLSRLGHAYCIILGLLSIFLARAAPTWRRSVGEWLLAASAAVTLLVIVLVGAGAAPTAALAGGPLAVAASTLLCLTGGTAFLPSSLLRGRGGEGEGCRRGGVTPPLPAGTPNPSPSSPLPGVPGREENGRTRP